MRQSVAWAIAFKNSYQHRVFVSTWINIVVFHTFFVLVLAIVFYFTLDYAKVTIFTAITSLLKNVVSGIPPDSSVLETATTQVDHVSLIVLICAFIFAILTSITAAYITLKPTRRALAMQKQFISAVAHELRTPLSVLRTNNEVALYDIKANAPVRETIQETITETIHLSNVLNNLLIFSRVDTTETMPFDTVDVNEIVEIVIKKLQNLANRKNVELITSFGPSVVAYGNQTAIEQTLYNVIKNAITYSKPTKAEVRIQTANQSSTVCVRVSDNGIGVSKKDLPHIFSPFFRANEARNSTESMGLGLALVYEVMKLHQGNISIHSEVSKGTTIALFFRRPLTLVSKGHDDFNNPNTIEHNFKRD